MLIDVPEVLREVVEKYGARPSHEGAESLITTLKDEVDAYAQAFKKLADEIWERDYKGTIYYKDYKSERQEYLRKLQEEAEKNRKKEEVRV
jgi:methionine salvage enolase-phosphatase E1